MMNYNLSSELNVIYVHRIYSDSSCVTRESALFTFISHILISSSRIYYFSFVFWYSVMHFYISVVRMLSSSLVYMRLS